MIKVISDLVLQECPLSYSEAQATQIFRGMHVPYFQNMRSKRSSSVSKSVAVPAREQHSLDLGICSDYSLIYDVSTLPAPRNSDHYGIQFNLKYVRYPTSYYGQARLDEISEHLQTVDWIGTFICLHAVNEMYDSKLCSTHH